MVAASGADAHAFLLFTSPSNGVVLAAAPSEVTLRFSEPVTPFGRGIEVLSPGGRNVAMPAVAAGGALTARLRLPAPPEAGTYLVTWRVTADDTHPSSGSFTFSVGHAGARPQAAAGAGGSGIGLTIEAVARWLHFLGFSAALGVLMYEVVVRRRPGWAELRAVVGMGLVSLAAGAGLAVVGQAASLGGIDAASLADVTASPLGRVVALQLGGALLLWAALPVLAGSTDRARVAVPVLGLGMAAVDGLAGHSGGGTAFALTWAITSLHVAAMGTWVGGIIAMSWLLRMQRLDAAEAARFGRIAATSLLVAVATGVGLAAIHLPGPLDLLRPPYGLVLGLKILIVGMAIAAAVVSRRRGRPVLFEAGAVVVVLALASILGSLPPIR